MLLYTELFLFTGKGKKSQELVWFLVIYLFTFGIEDLPRDFTLNYTPIPFYLLICDEAG